MTTKPPPIHKPSSPKAAGRRRSPLLNPVVAIPAVVVLAGAAGFAFLQWQEMKDAAAERERVLVAVDAAVGARPPDGSELSRVFAMLQHLPDHDTAHDLLAAGARIELARDRAERAEQMFGVVASRPGALPDELALGARILLRLHETGGADASRAAGMLQQIIAMGDGAYRQRRDPGDLLCVWQAADRAGDAARAKQVAAELQADHGESPQAKFVAFAVAFNGDGGVAAVDAATADLWPQPIEADAMRAFAALRDQDLTRALAIVESALPKGGGVGIVRWMAAIVFHAAVQGTPPGSAERARWIGRRNAQIDWIVAQPSTSADRREKAAKMREEQ